MVSSTYISANGVNVNDDMQIFIDISSAVNAYVTYMTLFIKSRLAFFILLKSIANTRELTMKYNSHAERRKLFISQRFIV